MVRKKWGDRADRDDMLKRYIGRGRVLCLESTISVNANS